MDGLRARSNRSALGASSRMSDSAYAGEAGAYAQVRDIINIQIESNAQDQNKVSV